MYHFCNRLFRRRRVSIMHDACAVRHAHSDDYVLLGSRRVLRHDVSWRYIVDSHVQGSVQAQPDMVSGVLFEDML